METSSLLVTMFIFLFIAYKVVKSFMSFLLEFSGTKKSLNEDRFHHKAKYAYHGLRCYSKGLTNGERDVVEYLSNKLDTKRYYIFNNLTLETKEGSTQIDHVVVSPYGIFVIETKDYSGWIFGDRGSKVWTQSLPRGSKNTFQNPYRQNYKHIKTLQEYLPSISEEAFKTVIAFNRKAEFKTERPSETRYFDELVWYIRTFNKQVVSKPHFFMTIGKLSQLCQSVDISPMEHIANLKRNHPGI